MTTGDPKQAAILAIVAIGALGFVVYRILPRPEPTASIPLSPRLAKPDSDEAKKDMPTVVISNAFWHSKIGDKKPTPTPSGSKRIVETEGPVLPVSPFGRSLGPIRPDENTGNDQQLRQGPTISVTAIIGSENRHEALVRFGTQEWKVRVGTKIEDVMVVAITDTTVRIRIGDREVVVAVGEEKQL